MLLKTEVLTRHYKGSEIPALNNVSLTVNEGEIVCLAGESGSGKSTLLRLIAGLDVPDGGKVFIEDQVISDGHRLVPPEKRGVGMVFQDYALFPHMNIRRNIGFGLRGMPKSEKNFRIDEMLELLHMTGMDKRYPHELSGGQCQRVAVARAMAPKPKVMLFDEAFCGLDRQLRDIILQEVRSLLKKTGMTAICVTHDISDALHIADRLAILRHGELLQFDSPVAIYDQPFNAYIAGFFGETNLVRATKQDNSWWCDFGCLTDLNDAIEQEELLFSLRPQDLLVAQNNKGDDHGLRATVTRVCFIGHCVELICQASSGVCYRAHISAEKTFVEGEVVFLTANVRRLRSLSS